MGSGFLDIFSEDPRLLTDADMQIKLCSEKNTVVAWVEMLFLTLAML